MMKKVLVTILALVVFGALSTVKADSTNVVTNAIGQVVTTITSMNGLRVTSIVDSSVVAAPSDTRVSFVGAQLATDTNLAVTCTNYVPRNFGDVLIGVASTNGTIFMANGVAVTDWVQLSN